MRVGVVGAGITGIALCHHLVKRDVPVRVFEVEEHAGGVIQSTDPDGVVLEHGPQRVRRTEAVDELIEAAGIAGEVRTANGGLPLYVYADGALRTAPTTVRRLLTTDLLSWRAKLRLLAEPFTAPGQPDETAADLFRRKFGDEAYETVLGPLFGGIYASEPERMPASHALEPLLDLEAEEGSLLKLAVKRVVGRRSSPAISFDAGLQRLPQALAETYADQVSLGRAVTDIEPRHEGFRVMARGEFMAADAVVLTTKAPHAADLLEPLDAASADALRDLRYNGLAVVHLRSSADARGLGYQVHRDEDLSTLGVSWNASTFDRDDLYTAFLGGMADPGLIDLDRTDIAEIAQEEFEGVMDAPAEVVNVTRLPRAIPAWDESWEALDRVSLPEGIFLETNYTGRVGVPSRVRAAEALAEQLADRPSA